MNGSLFLMIMIGVAWLVVWCCVDHSKPSTTWWPFAMRVRDAMTPAPSVTKRTQQAGSQKITQPVQTARQNPNRQWQRFDS